MKQQILHTLALALLTSAAAVAQNDECSGAIPLTSGVPVTFDMSGATRSAPSWSCAGADRPDLWYSYTTTIPNSRLTVETCGSQFLCPVEVFSGPCNALVSRKCSSSGCGFGTSTIVFADPVGSTHFIRVAGDDGVTGMGLLVVTETTNPCVGPLFDDPLEENDTCASPTVLASGSYPNLGVSLVDPDFYQVALNPGDTLRVSIVGPTFADDVDVNLYDQNCVLIQSLFGGFLYRNLTGAPQDVIYEVFADPTMSTLGCANYDMEVTVTPGFDCLTPDAFEDNDSCATARPIVDGLYRELNVTGMDRDFYEFGVEAGATVTLDIFFTAMLDQVDLYLWDPTILCGTDVGGIGQGSGALAFGFSNTDNEQIVYTNTTGVAQTLVAEVDVRFPEDCNGYDLMLAGSSSTFGTNYCAANPNSTGGTGAITGTGSRIAARNDVVLTASGLPNNAFGYVLVSLSTGFIANPNGSQGNLCLGGAIGRYVGPGQILSTMNAGEFSLALDLTTTPQPTGSVAVVPGDTWNYQVWHRDVVNGAVTSNFTNGISVTFQ